MSASSDNAVPPAQGHSLIGIRGTIESMLLRPIRRFFQFFGPISVASLFILLIVGVVFLWAWQYQDWRARISAIAAGLGAVLGAAAGLISEKEKGRWVLACAGGVFTAWVGWYTVADLTKELNDKTEIADALSKRLNILKDDVVSYLKPIPENELFRALTDAGEKLRNRFNEEEKTPPFASHPFDPAIDVLDIISTLSKKNGHVYYFRGEIERKLGYPEKGHQQFYAYIEAENGRTKAAAIGGEACGNADGFCRERTGWIFHLLANDFYEAGKELKAAGRPEYKSSFSQALKHTCSAIQYHPPDGFNDPTQLMPTRALEKLLHDELGERCPPLPN